MSSEFYSKRLEQLAKESARDPHVVEALLNSYFHLTQTELIQSQEVTLPGLGALKVSEQEATTLVQADGKLIDLPPQPLVKFTLASNVRRRWSLIKAHPKSNPVESISPSTSSTEGVVTAGPKPTNDPKEPALEETSVPFFPEAKPQVKSEPKILTEEELKAFKQKKQELTILFTLSVIFLGLLIFLIVNQIASNSLSEIMVRDIFVSSNTYEEVSFTYNDSLKTLAEKYYGGTSNWPYLYFENLETIVSPEQLFPGKDHVFLKYQTNLDLAELYFNLYLNQSNVSMRSHLDYLSTVYSLKSNRILRLKDSLPEAEKKYLGL